MKHILIVDDTEDIILLTCDILHIRHYEVRTASSGKECLEKVKASKPDMILLDIMMPGMNGFEVIDELEMTGLAEGIKIVIYSVKRPFEEDMRRLMRNPDYHYIGKPVGTQELLEKLETIFAEEADGKGS